MVQAKVKCVEITEVPDLDPVKYAPETLDDFGCTFGLTIGPANTDGGELFYLTVCTPSWLVKACEKDGFLWGRHHLIVAQYDLTVIAAIINKFVGNCSGDSWPEVASKLGRIAAWEFEECRESDGG